MAEFEGEMQSNDIGHPPGEMSEEEYGLKLAAGVLFTHIDKDE